MYSHTWWKEFLSLKGKTNYIVSFHFLFCKATKLLIAAMTLSETASTKYTDLKYEINNLKIDTIWRTVCLHRVLVIMSAIGTCFLVPLTVANFEILPCMDFRMLRAFWYIFRSTNEAVENLGVLNHCQAAGPRKPGRGLGDQGRVCVSLKTSVLVVTGQYVWLPPEIAYWDCLGSGLS